MIVTDAVAATCSRSGLSPTPSWPRWRRTRPATGFPVVEPATGQLLHVLALACGAERIVEVGTAIGVSTLYMARALPAGGKIVSFEVDPERHAAARDYLERAGVLDRADLRLQDARDGLALARRWRSTWHSSTGSRRSTATTSTCCCRCCEPAVVLAVDNVLMSGTVAEGRSDGDWTDQQIAGAREFNGRLIRDRQLSGDGHAGR